METFLKKFLMKFREHILESEGISWGTSKYIPRKFCGSISGRVHWQFRIEISDTTSEEVLREPTHGRFSRRNPRKIPERTPRGIVKEILEKNWPTTERKFPNASQKI